VHAIRERDKGVFTVNSNTNPRLPYLTLPFKAAFSNHSVQSHSHLWVEQKQEEEEQLEFSWHLRSLKLDCETQTEIYKIQKYKTWKNEWTSTPHRWNVSLRRNDALVLAMTLTFDFWPWKLFAAMPTHMANISTKFHWNSSTRCDDIVSHEIRVNGHKARRKQDGRTDGQTTSLHNALRLQLLEDAW